jgi:two-component system, cell cycle sensor histidine kinase and response regulator CckA
MKDRPEKNKGRLAVRHSLGTRFSLHIFLVLIIANFFSLLYIYKAEQNNNLLDLRNQAEVIGNYIASSVSQHLLNYDFVSLDTTLHQAMQLQGLHYTAILANNENYIAARVSPLLLKLSRKAGAPPPSAKNHLRIVQLLREKSVDHIDISAPVIFGDNYLGRVIVGLSLDVSRKKTKDFLTFLLVVNAIVALFIALGVYFFFWKKTLQPIYHLIDGANRVAHGNYDKPVFHTGSDEIGLLTESFNTMMSARKKAKEDTLKSRKDWERLFNAVDDVVTIQDNNMCILQANDAAGRLLDKDPSELIGMHCYKIFRNLDEPCKGCPTVQCLQEHHHHHADIEYPELSKSFHVSAFPIQDKDQGWSGIAHIARDITNQKKLENQYQQAQKMEAIGTLAGGIAHDFNNILTPIFGYAQLIKMDAEPASQLDININHILHSSQLAQQLVKQILTFSRERQHEVHVVQLQPIIKESMKLLRSSIPTTIEFKLNFEEGCGNVMADPTQIHQIIMNICTNAYHAMEESGGILAVTLSQTHLDEVTAHLRDNLAPGDYIKLQISDTGCGMDETTRERILEPFFTTKTDGKGTGMGLSVVHGIVKEYGGSIVIYSESGVGSTFTIYFPVISQSVPSETLPQMAPTKSLPGGTEQILVVDDERSIIELEQRILESVGYEVTPFIDSEQALDAFQKSPDLFDLVITDMTMPKITGIQLAEKLVTIRNDIPVILCTGHSRISMDELQKHPGITDYLAKPINLHQFTKVVHEVLEKQKQQ